MISGTAVVKVPKERRLARVVDDEVIETSKAVASAGGVISLTGDQGQSAASPFRPDTTVGATAAVEAPKERRLARAVEEGAVEICKVVAGAGGVTSLTGDQGQSTASPFRPDTTVGRTAAVEVPTERRLARAVEDGAVEKCKVVAGAGGVTSRTGDQGQSAASPFRPDTVDTVDTVDANDAVEEPVLEPTERRLARAVEDGGAERYKVVAGAGGGGGISRTGDQGQSAASPFRPDTTVGATAAAKAPRERHLARVVEGGSAETCKVVAGSGGGTSGECHGPQSGVGRGMPGREEDE